MTKKKPKHLLTPLYTDSLMAYEDYSDHDSWPKMSKTNNLKLTCPQHYFFTSIQQ